MASYAWSCMANNTLVILCDIFPLGSTDYNLRSQTDFSAG